MKPGDRVRWVGKHHAGSMGTVIAVNPKPEQCVHIQGDYVVDVLWDIDKHKVGKKETKTEYVAVAGRKNRRRVTKITVTTAEDVVRMEGSDALPPAMCEVVEE